MDLGEIRQAVLEIAGRKNNVTLSEIEKLVAGLKRNGYTVRSRPAGDHAVLFNINGNMFSVCSHNPKRKQIKPCYVREFLRVMSELELYEG